MILNFLSIDFEASEIAFRVPYSVMVKREWFAGSAEVNIDAVSNVRAAGKMEGVQVQTPNNRYAAALLAYEEWGAQSDITE